MSGGVTVTRISDQRWLVGGVPVTPPTGSDPIAFVLEHAHRIGGVPPVNVEVHDSGAVLQLVIAANGSVAAAPGGSMSRALLRWIRPAGALPAAPQPATAPPPLPSGLDRQVSLRDVVDQVDARDWEAVTAHAFERSSAHVEARALGVSVRQYTESLDRVRAVVLSAINRKAR